ncbi:excinuclease ABC subunit B [Candidatus Shapirobacteria bacterium CG10_big_fil_rev_8_21_14_0_10_40_9]|uniref:UvrABC system protein B n=1 Tax=Candidatus Shapirobacteria bacterium CG10_big_fil_rev_8_21_14_0_10_40_9 TaxID=1974888 RepID=A0A2M8L3Y0_9BACT|nr:MAG: excinuclease ABC subunit B [Candidatus Shapirobacteria bacterium CG10_big_fil_rev_8_21_14_0_10_40_9]
MKFKLRSSFKPTGDQPEAIEKLVSHVKSGKKHQVLLGVTGSGKTFTMANMIEKLQRPTLVISHNKTLAAQLYQEFRDFFPENAVSFFVSYYDYYQPEAYIPQTDTYIEKETEINELIDKLRLQATTNLLTRSDTIIIASVSCIYNIGSPREYGNYVLELEKELKIEREEILRKLTRLQYERADYGFHRGTFRVRGDTIDIFPAYEDVAVRIGMEGNRITKIAKIDPLNGKIINHQSSVINSTIIYPTKHYMTDPKRYSDVFSEIRSDLKERIKYFKKRKKEIEAYRLERRVNYDLEMIGEIGYVSGIENYSRYFDGRKPGEPPYTLLDYYKEAYKEQWLLFIDESHMTIPQIEGMFNGDRSRKETLVKFGFRLPAALDNRPLKFAEFLHRAPQTIYTSATPADWELKKTDRPVEQLIRPTGIPDPEISIRKTEGQIDDLISEIDKRVKVHERVLVTTLTKRMAEDLALYLQEKQIKVHYLHSEIQTLDRSDILDDLRLGKYDVVVGINLLREGLDLPEVSLVAILDADKEGFLRSKTSLIQVMGRAARHINGQVIMYADKFTGSMQRAIEEVRRRRDIQLKYNKKHKIVPKSIQKPIREKLVAREEKISPFIYGVKSYQTAFLELEKLDPEQLTPEDRNKLIKNLRREMKEAASDLNFELAAEIRDKIKEIEVI